MNYYLMLYIIIVSMCCLFVPFRDNGRRKEKTFFFCSFILTTFLVMFRYTPYYADFRNYTRFYENASVFSVEIMKESKSSILFVISYLLNKVTDNPQMYFIFCGLFINIRFFKWMYRYSENIYISILTFIGLNILPASMNVVRQYFATAVLLYGYKWYSKRKKELPDYIKSALLVFIAFLIHPSSIVSVSFLFMTWVPLPKDSLKAFILFLAAFFVAGFGISLGLERLYSGYMTDGTYGTESASVFGIVIPLIVFLLAWTRRKRLIVDNQDGKFLIISSLCGLIFTIHSVRGMIITARIANYFTVFNILLLPASIEKRAEIMNKRDRTIVVALAITAFFAAYYITGRMILINELNFLF